MITRGKIMLAATLLSAVALAGCASAPAEAPEWYAERDAAEARGYPSLHDVPGTTIANTDPAHWAGVEAEVLAAGAALKAHPRAEPAGVAAPEAFIAEARDDLDRARDAHEP